MTMNINSIRVAERKLVKPFTPTPSHLRNYKFSFIDENLPAMDIGVLLFYQPSSPESDSRLKLITTLEESLSKVLPQFYPLAGRFIVDDHAVDCNDQGAEFIHAQAPSLDLPTLLQETNLPNLYPFLPRQTHQVDVSTYPILSTQITELSCGGLVIGISISHKIFDASSLSTFVAAWSNASNPEGNRDRATVAPTLDSPSLFPSKNLNKNPVFIIHGTENQTMSVKKFTFSKDSIASLRSSLGPQGIRVSRVRAASAVIAKALIGLDRAKHGRPRDCLITQAVNMRERTTPPLHKHACGNLILLAVCHCKAAPEVGIQELVDLLGDATSKSISGCSEILSLAEDERNGALVNPLKTVSQTFRSGEMNVLTFTDYSKFGFYEADFGWGKPEWAAIDPQPSGNITVLMENKGGDGIEAWVHLDKDDMVVFEQNEEIRFVCNLG